MSFLKYCSFFFIIILYPTLIIGQQNSYIHYTKTNGLLSLNVYSCAQDKEGFMWFGTEYGLCRYDGKKFYTYTNKDGLPDNEIIQVIADKDGAIWGRTYTKEIFCYYKGTFYTHFDDYLKNLSVEYIESDSRGGVWLYPNFIAYKQDPTIKAFYLRNQKVQKVVYYPKSPHDSLRQRTRRLYETKDAYVMNTGAENWYIRKSSPPTLLKQEKRVRISEGKVYKNIYFNFEHFQYDLVYHDTISSLIVYKKNNKGEFEYHSQQKFPCRLLDIYLHKDKLYISLQNGGYIITNTDLSHVDVNNRFLPNVYIGKIFADKQDNFWFTSSTEGIFFLPKNPIKILGRKEGINIKMGHSVYVDEAENIFIGSSLGQMYKIKGSTIDSFSYSKIRQNERVVKILKDKNKRIWFGTDKSVYVVQNGKVDTVGAKRAVKNLLVTKDNHYLYVCSHEDVQKYDLSIYPFKSKGEIILNKVCFGITEDTNGGIWLGNRDSLYYYKEGKVQNISKKINQSILRKIYKLAFSEDGTLWVASNINGLIAIKDFNIQTVIQDTTNGITNTACSALHIDAQNNVWLGTRAGLNKIAYRYEKGILTYKVNKFSISNGFKDDEILDVFVRNSFAYVATNEGIYLLEDVPKSDAHDIEKTHIWRLQVGSKQVPLKDNYIFSYNIKQITLHFSRLCFDCADDAIYEYRLLPEQTHWTSINEQNVSFNYLNSGNYQFEVRLKDKPTSVSVFSFTIETPFWKRKIAIFVYILVLIGLIYRILSFYLNLTIQKEREAKNIKHKISELEMKAIKSQMNPHFIFNCIQSIQYYYSVGDSLNANNYISKFAQLIRSTLEISEKPFIPISEEAAYLDTYLLLEEMRFRNLFSYSIEISEEIDKNRQMFPALLLQPYVENAIKHGIRNNPKQKGEIIIRFLRRENRLICEVEDNGVGRVRAMEIKNKSFMPRHDSKGMKLSHNRIELLNEIGDNINIQLEIIDKYNEVNEATGTLIRISMPLHFEEQESIQYTYIIHIKRIIQKVKQLFISNSKGN